MCGEEESGGGVVRKGIRGISKKRVCGDEVGMRGTERVSRL